MLFSPRRPGWTFNPRGREPAHQPLKCARISPNVPFHALLLQVRSASR
jgi:hypothetical protein